MAAREGSLRKVEQRARGEAWGKVRLTKVNRAQVIWGLLGHAMFLFHFLFSSYEECKAIEF